MSQERRKRRIKQMGMPNWCECVPLTSNGHARFVVVVNHTCHLARARPPPLLAPTPPCVSFAVSSSSPLPSVVLSLRSLFLRPRSRVWHLALFRRKAKRARKQRRLKVRSMAEGQTRVHAYTRTHAHVRVHAHTCTRQARTHIPTQSAARVLASALLPHMRTPSRPAFLRPRDTGTDRAAPESAAGIGRRLPAAESGGLAPAEWLRHARCRPAHARHALFDERSPAAIAGRSGRSSLAPWVCRLLIVHWAEWQQNGRKQTHVCCVCHTCLCAGPTMTGSQFYGRPQLVQKGLGQEQALFRRLHAAHNAHEACMRGGAAYQVGSRTDPAHFDVCLLTSARGPFRVRGGAFCMSSIERMPPRSTPAPSTPAQPPRRVAKQTARAPLALPARCHLPKLHRLAPCALSDSDR